MFNMDQNLVIGAGNRHQQGLHSTNGIQDIREYVLNELVFFI